jgi:hypothetical protein
MFQKKFAEGQKDFVTQSKLMCLHPKRKIKFIEFFFSFSSRGSGIFQIFIEIIEKIK